MSKVQEHSRHAIVRQSSSKRNLTIQSYTLVKDHLPIVQTIARRYCRGKQDLLEDLIQVGAIGLLKAVRCYNPSHPNKASFKTLAICYISRRNQTLFKRSCIAYSCAKTFNGSSCAGFNLGRKVKPET